MAPEAARRSGRIANSTAACSEDPLDAAGMPRCAPLQRPTGVSGLCLRPTGITKLPASGGTGLSIMPLATATGRIGATSAKSKDESALF
jgi:hypothetical protein